jgi:hypothetical protein
VRGLSRGRLASISGLKREIADGDGDILGVAVAVVGSESPDATDGRVVTVDAERDEELAIRDNSEE